MFSSDPSIETVFIRITNMNTAHTIGAMYIPPDKSNNTCNESSMLNRAERQRSEPTRSIINLLLLPMKISTAQEKFPF